MENFTEAEIKEIESMEDLKDMINVLDSVLDGEAFHIRSTETDMTMKDDLKPILPKGLVEEENAVSLNSKALYAYTLRVLIALLIDLNPIGTWEEEDYCFRMAIIVNAITSGCIIKSNNWKFADITFDKKFMKEEGKKYVGKHKELIEKINKNISGANNFLAFSTMNMVRFNHHFPIEKYNLISKSLVNLPEDHKARILEEEKMETFYDCFVSAARVLNDKKYYERYILQVNHDMNKYYYYNILGAYDVKFEEQIVKIRTVNTPNGFLIMDIINEIYQDLKGKKVLFAIPYKNEIAEILKLRNHIRLNPFSYHPSKNFYKCQAADYEEVVNKFQFLMKKIGSFIYQYSETMYESVRSAKCRKKYEKNITKEDEILVKTIISILKVDITIDDKTKDIIRKKLYTSDIKIDENTDLNKLNKEVADYIEGEMKKEVKF